MDRLVDDVMAMRPRLVLTVDVRVFHCVLPVIAPPHAQAGWSAPIVHTVAPTVWAGRGARANLLPYGWDVCLFPLNQPISRVIDCSPVCAS